MRIRTDNLPWPMDNGLRQILQEELLKAGITDAGATLTFKDPDYTPETGGFHPVEVAVDAGGHVLYITDFAYVGRPPYCELEKEIDFDFAMGVFQHFGRTFPIGRGAELFSLWQSNFLAYHCMGVYTVTANPL